MRVGKRFADALDAEWLVVSVETPQLLKLSESAAQPAHRRAAPGRIARRRDGHARWPSAAEALLEYASLRNVTRIVIGEAKRTGWRAWLRRSTADRARAPRPRLRRLGHRAPRTRADHGARDVPDSAPRRDPLGALLGGAADLRMLHRRRGAHVPVFRADQSRHGLPARRHRRGAAARPRTGKPDRGRQRRRIRFLLRAAPLHFRSRAISSTS